MLIKRAFKFKLNPTRVQEELFLRFAGAKRWVFNRGLDQRKKAFEQTGKSPSYFDQNKELTQLKEQPQTAWLKEIHSQVLQQGLKDLDRAFQNFFGRVKKGEKPGHPKFKWGERAKAPKLWLETYPEASFESINPSNYLPFIS